MSPLAVEWNWVAASLVGLLPVAGIAIACVVAWRSGWQALAVSGFVWAAVGFLLFGVVLPGSSAADGAAIALFLFLVPWLLCGSFALLVRQRRDDRRPISQR